MSRLRAAFLSVLLLAILAVLGAESGLVSLATPWLHLPPPSHLVAMVDGEGATPVVKNVPPPPNPPQLSKAAHFSCTSSSAVWREVWGDEFSSSATDYRWNIITGNPGKNGEIEAYTAAGIQASGGNLVLETARTASGGYTSGAVDTKGTFSMLYGKLVIRAKLGLGQGLWPGFWLRPVNGSLLPEIDIVEVLESQPNILYMTLHWLSANGPTHTYIAYKGPNAAQAFHTYTLVWLPDELNWYLDGKLVQHITAHVPHVPMYLTLDAAVGSPWGGYPTPNQPMPQKVLVDYVRAYQYGLCSKEGFTAIYGGGDTALCDCRVAVFVLHQISATNPGPYDIAPAVLAEDMRYLLSRGMRFMTLRQFYAYEEGRWRPRGAWALMTFDDGYSSIYRNGAPILRRHHIPAVLFVIGSRLDTESFWMSRAEVRRLARSGLWAVEAHTYREHHVVSGMPALVYLNSTGQNTTIIHDVWRELATVRALSGKEPFAFAFPYGQDTPGLVRLLHRSYSLLFTTKYALTQPFDVTIPRIDLGSPRTNVALIWKRWFSRTGSV